MPPATKQKGRKIKRCSTPYSDRGAVEALDMSAHSLGVDPPATKKRRLVGRALDDKQTLKKTAQQVNIESGVDSLVEEPSSSPCGTSPSTVLRLQDFVPGTFVLGVVASVGKEGLWLHLPFYVKALVPLSHTSESATQFTAIDLRALYRQGDLVQAVVVSNDGWSLECSLRPSLINAGFTLHNVKPHLWLPCMLTEFDNGGNCWKGSLGISNVKVVLSQPKHNSIACAARRRSFRPGFVVNVGLCEIDLSTLTITSTIDPKAACLGLSEVLDITLLRPGFLVRSLVEHLPTRKRVTIPSFTTVHPQSSFAPMLSSERERPKATDAEVLVRLTVVIPDPATATAKVFATDQQHVVSWETCPILTLSRFIGKHFRNATIIGVDPQGGARLKGAESRSDSANACGSSDDFVVDVLPHDSCESNGGAQHILHASLQKSGHFPEVRIVDFSLFEGALRGTAEPELLKEKALSPFELLPGQRLTGMVCGSSKGCVFVRLNPYMVGVLPRDHMWDMPKAEIPSKFQKGAQIQCRVWNVNLLTETVWLTAKETLLLAETQTLDAATPGQRVYGVLGKNDVASDTVPVYFFGGYSARVSRSEFSGASMRHDKPGWTVCCTLLRVNHLLRHVVAVIAEPEQQGVKRRVRSSEDPIHLTSMVVKAIASLATRHCVFSHSQLSTALKQCGGSFGNGFFQQLTMQRNVMQQFWSDINYTTFGRDHLDVTGSLCRVGMLVHHVIPFELIQDHVVVLCAVRTTSSSSLLCNLKPGATDNTAAVTLALIPTQHLSDEDRSVTVESLEDGSLAKSLETVVVLAAAFNLWVSLPGRKIPITLPLLSAKPSLVDAAQRGEFVIDLADLEPLEHAVRSSYIRRITRNALHVSLGNWDVVGKLPLQCTAASTCNAPVQYVVGQTLQVRITSIRGLHSTQPGSLPFVADARPSVVSASDHVTFTSSEWSSPEVVKAFDSLPVSFGKPPKDQFDVTEGNNYPAIVKSAGRHGVFVYLNTQLVVRIRLNQLSESPIAPERVGALYPPLKRIPAVRILKIVSRDPPRIEASIIEASRPFELRYSDLSIGDVVAGVIKSKINCGLFVRFEESRLDGFCHMSEIMDCEGDMKGRQLRQHQEKALEMYNVGERVAARILSLDPTSQRCTVTLRPAAFDEEVKTLQQRLAEARGLHTTSSDDEDDGASCDSDHSPVANDTTTNESKRLPRHCHLQDEDNVKGNDGHEDDILSDSDASNCDTRDIKAAVRQKRELPEDTSDLKGSPVDTDCDSDLSDANEETKTTHSNKTVSEEPETTDDDERPRTQSESSSDETSSPEHVNAALNRCLNAFAEKPTSKTVGLEGKQTLSGVTNQEPTKKPRKILDLDTESEDIDSEVDGTSDDEFPTHRMGLKKRQKRQSAAAKLRAQEIEAAEADGVIAETVEDFERLSLTDGDSAALWIRYMAYYLKMQDVDRARCIAERGVQRINGQEEEERLNLWVAYLNLEAVFGTPASLESVTRRALQFNDPKKVLLRLTFVYQTHGSPEQCLDACKRCIEKYPESKKMWIRYLTCIYECTSQEPLEVTVRGILIRALRRLPPRKHIAVITAVGRLEFRHGSSERGRTYFEKLLAEHPKRTDLWGQYLDAISGAVTSGSMSAESARTIFAKPTTLSGLKPRQMKYFFTRWLTFEKTIGTPDQAREVQEKARDYVESLRNTA